jgi:hypothetical protein
MKQPSHRMGSRLCRESSDAAEARCFPVVDWGAATRGSRFIRSRAPPPGWHPPLVEPSRLRKVMGSKNYKSLLNRELQTYEEKGLVPFGYPASESKKLETFYKNRKGLNQTRTIQSSYYKQDDSDWESTCGSSSVESSFGGLMASGPSKRETPHLGRTIGPAWWLQPLPLAQREERHISTTRRWRGYKGMLFGDYKVAPDRYDLKWIQRIFWAGRQIRGVTRFILSNTSPCQFLAELKCVRNQIYSLSPGNGQTSDFQRKLLSDVYFCLRQCNRLADERGSSIRAAPPSAHP